MKKYIYYTFILTNIFFAINVKGQDAPKPGTNYLNSSLDKFVGNWFWVNKADTIWLNTKKEMLNYLPDKI